MIILSDITFSSTGFKSGRFSDWEDETIRKNLGSLAASLNVIFFYFMNLLELTKVETMDQFIERTELKSNYNYVSV
jgi:hypothetical protein